ncbi:MAG TPA: XdhC/CoxI family protein [Chloroflexota bacterium]|nr:XdhC/CoxI family protein [Chloroflexota bacterium]
MAADAGLSAIVPVVETARRAGKGVAVAVLVRSQRTSVPRRMVVLEDGETHGSLHQALDPIVIRDALASLAARRSRLRSYRATGAGRLEAVRVQEGDEDVFFDVLSRPPRLIVVGAGHIAQPLASLGSILDFDVTVLDDRAEYARSERFPEAETVLVGPYRETLAALGIDGDTYVVLVTRGHVHDQACLEEVLPTPAAYIGMIGSKRRVNTVLEHLREKGFAVERLKEVRAPVGLDLGARTPAEIALAIMAEIVQVRQGGTGRPLSGSRGET